MEQEYNHIIDWQLLDINRVARRGHNQSVIPLSVYCLVDL